MFRLPLESLLRFLGVRSFVEDDSKYAQAQAADERSMPLLAKEQPPPAHFRAKIHPSVESISAEVDGYFLKHWPFQSEKDRRKCLAAGFSRVTCLYYPLALDDRIHFACRLLTLLFLIDGEYPLSRTSRTG